METSFRVKGRGGFCCCGFVRNSNTCGKDINQDSEECVGLSPVQKVARLSAKKWKRDSKAILFFDTLKYI